MKSLLGQAVWLITAIGSIHLGLIGLGFNWLELPFVQNNLAALIIPLHYVFGIAGVLSLIMMMQGCSGNCPAEVQPLIFLRSAASRWSGTFFIESRRTVVRV